MASGKDFVRRSPIYAIIQSGGKQYKVAPGQMLEVERLSAEPGSTVELSDVLLIADDDEITVGKPTIPGAKVVATVEDHQKGPKIIVFKYKPKTHYRRKLGHRQIHTKLAIREIITGKTTKRSRKAKEVTP